MIDAKIGDPDPLQAIGNELQSGQSYEAIVLSTLPQGVSRWLRRDVVSRLRREFPSIRVEHVVSERPPIRRGRSGRRFQLPMSGRALSAAKPGQLSGARLELESPARRSHRPAGARRRVPRPPRDTGGRERSLLPLFRRRGRRFSNRSMCGSNSFVLVFNKKAVVGEPPPAKLRVTIEANPGPAV